MSDDGQHDAESQKAFAWIAQRVAAALAERGGRLA
jgi:hypothetical protein